MNTLYIEISKLINPNDTVLDLGTVKKIIQILE